MSQLLMGSNRPTQKQQLHQTKQLYLRQPPTVSLVYEVISEPE